MKKSRLIPVLLVAFAAVPHAVRADYLIFSGATWDAAPVYGTIPTPSGIDFDIDVERQQLIGMLIAPADLLIFDLTAGKFEVVENSTPAELLDESGSFRVYSREIDVQLHTEDRVRFVSGPSDLEMEAVGALVWVGNVMVPYPGGGPPGGGGGSSPDSDFDGVPNASDNCPTASNPGQADNDGDGLGDACDSDDDDDGLIDRDEILTYGTNPFFADTDGDGHSDFDEVAAGTDPLDPNDPLLAPALGPAGWVVLSVLLLGLGVGFGFDQRGRSGRYAR